jgi:ABC-type multidrug transport system fused ATPase/permease subunit
MNKYATILKDVDLKVDKGQMIMIIGPVGCGKSSILKSMMGLLHKKAGTLQKNGKISYIPQESFLINNTFRQNIVFGHEFDEAKYRKVIDIAQLQPDLDVIKGGEFAEIGEKGLNLSGGQKQRISIARAIYADTDIVLIDDSLSALDAHVGKNIFFNVFVDQFIKKGKTVVMCTHVLEYLDQADKVVFMEQGQIVCQGTYEELKSSDPDFRTFISEEEERKKSSQKNIQIPKNNKKSKFAFDSAVFDEFPNNDKIQEELDQIESIADVDMSMDPIRSARDISLNQSASLRKSTLREEQAIPKQGTRTDQVKMQEGKLLKEEQHIKGDIKKGVFWRYFKSGGICLFFLCHLFIFLTVLSKIMIDFWVGSWSQNTFKFAQDKAEFYYMLGYGMMILAMLVIGTIQSFLWSIFSTNAGLKIFRDLLKNVMKKPMSYFDTTPIGQILNLLGKDTDLIDTVIPNSSLGVFTNSYQFIGIVILSSMSNLIMIPVVIIVFSILGYLIRAYLNLQRETKRLELLMASPIISNIIELYNGILVFRNYDKINYVRETYKRNINKQSQVILHSRYVGCMMQCYSEIIMAFFIGGVFLLISLGVIFEWPFIPKNISLLSLTLNWVITIPSFINFFLFRYSMFIQYMSSAERIFYNVDADLQEGDYLMPKPALNNKFPSTGIIEVKNIKVRYRENLPLVLNGVSFITNPNEKIGIVGRTGSGKSSLLLALTRMINVENSVFYKQVMYDQKLGEFKNVDKTKVPRPASSLLKNGEYFKFTGTQNSLTKLNQFTTEENNQL